MICTVTNILYFVSSEIKNILAIIFDARDFNQSPNTMKSHFPQLVHHFVGKGYRQATSGSKLRAASNRENLSTEELY